MHFDKYSASIIRTLTTTSRAADEEAEFREVKELAHIQIQAVCPQNPRSELLCRLASAHDKRSVK